MQQAKVIGTAHATVKHPSLAGNKLLVVQPLTASEQPDGHPLLVVDTVGSGVGERVLITSDGRYARQWLKHEYNPVRWTLVGIIDE